MKNISKIILVLFTVFTISCSNDELGNVDLGEYYGPYIHFKSGAKEVIPAGDTLDIPVSIYVPQWENFTVQYELRGSYSQTGTFTVESGNREDLLQLIIPVNPSITSDVVDTLFLVSATNGVKIGRQNVPSNNIIKKPIKIIAPDSGV